MSNIEQTLSIIKPDAVERNLESEIKEMFKINGFQILKSDNVKSLEKKVLKIEHEIYPKAIDKFLTNL